MKSTLDEFQNDFVNFILNQQETSSLLKGVKPGGTLPNAKAVLEVHQKGYIARLTEQLGETFEGVWWALGDTAFFRIAAQYIERTPSHSYNLIDYGKDFPLFLDTIPEAKQAPFLKDLARYEWLFRIVFHAADHQPLAREAFIQLHQNPDLKIEFGESVSLFDSPYRVYPIWKLRKKDIGKVNFPETRHPERLLLYKKEGQIYVQELKEAEYQLLFSLLSGQSFSSALHENEAILASVEADGFQSFFAFIGTEGVVKSLAKDLSSLKRS